MNIILSDVFFFYRQNFSRLIAYIIPVSIAMTLISVGIAHGFSGDDQNQHLKLMVVSHFLLNPLYLGGFTYLLYNISSNRSVSLSSCLIYGIYRWLPLLATLIVYGVLAGIGFLLFIFPGVWIFSRLIMAPFLVILDRNSPVDALTESYQSTGDEIWRIMGTTTLIFLVLILFQQLILSVMPDHIIAMVITSVIGDVLWSVLTILWFRFYDLIKHGN